MTYHLTLTLFIQTKHLNPNFKGNPILTITLKPTFEVVTTRQTIFTSQKSAHIVTEIWILLQKGVEVSGQLEACQYI